MQEVCNSLADTGNSLWLPIIVGGFCMFIAAVCLLYTRRHGKRFTYSGFGVLLFAALSMMLGLVVVGSQPAHAAATCNAAPGSTTSTPASPSQAGKLELIDDDYTDGPTTTNEYDERVLDILTNDQAPAGDPIDPTTVRLSGSASQYRDVGPDYDEPSGVNFDILNPSDPEGPTWGYVYMCTEDDGTGTSTWVRTGEVCVYFEDSVPAGTSFTMQYTAKTMSGINASNTATITFTVPPQPEAVDDNYTLGSSGGAALSVTDNDVSINPDNIELLNPNTEAGGTGDDYTVYVNELDDDSWIHWQIINQKVVVTFGNSVPLDAPYTIQYQDAISGSTATITVTRASTPPSAVTVANVDFPDSCGSHGGDTADVMAGASTTIGTVDPLSVDLNPFTAGRQTSYTDGNTTITVDNNGIVTITEPTAGAETGEHTFYYTISNTNGDVSGIGQLYTFPANCG